MTSPLQRGAIAVVLAAFAVGCHSAACLQGLPTSVASHCGCSPAQQRVEVAMAQTNLSDMAATVFHSCWTANLEASFKSAPDLAKGSFSACVDRSMTLDPGIKATLIKIVTDAAQPSSDPSEQARSQTWTQCSTTYMQ